MRWFDQFGRKDLPWQKDISPYSVWISEIMLQQTQVITVIGYFNRFLMHFPTIKHLANANLDEVLHLWTGLGYYARARNIHRTAKIIMHDYKGIFPNDLNDLMSLPGIGRSTAGAILSIAFKQSHPILDGNVKRVLSRYHALGEGSEKDLWTFAAQHTPEERCQDYTQAIMDLGATICTRTRPKCDLCPLQAQCIAYERNQVTEFPVRKKKKVLPIKSTKFLIIRDKLGRYLLEKRSPHGIWGGLWSFPEYQQEDIQQYCRRKFALQITHLTPGSLFRHTFTHYHLDITPIYIDIENKSLMVAESEFLWCLPNALPKVGLAAPVKKLLL